MGPCVSFEPPLLGFDWDVTFLQYDVAALELKSRSTPVHMRPDSTRGNFSKEPRRNLKKHLNFFLYKENSQVSA